MKLAFSPPTPPRLHTTATPRAASSNARLGAVYINGELFTKALQIPAMLRGLGFSVEKGKSRFPNHAQISKLRTYIGQHYQRKPGKNAVQININFQGETVELFQTRQQENPRTAQRLEDKTVTLTHGITSFENNDAIDTFLSQLQNYIQTHKS